MKTKISLLLAVSLIAGWTSLASSIELVNKEDVAINFHGRLQAFGFTNYVNDPFRDHLRLYLFLKQARIGFDGHVNKIKYDIELAFGGEEGLRNTAGTVANASLGLLDFNVDVPFLGNSYLKIGQFKVPYSLERLSHSKDLMFTDRSIQTLAFTAGRDVGVALYENAENYTYSLGLFTGAGRDIPIRNLPIRLGIPMISARAGFKSGIPDDLFDPKQIAFDSLQPGFAIFGNAFYIKDSRVGHSTVLQVKAVEKSLLTDSNWNPFISRKDITGASNFLLGDLWQIGSDAVIRTKVGSGLFSAEVEANYGQYKNQAGFLEATGGRIQLGYYEKPWGLALRYAVLFPDDKFAKGATNIFTNRNPIHEITPALTLFHRKYLKIVMDAPLLIDVPVSIEDKLGYYVLTDQPDQTGAGTIIRQTVPSARLLLQMAF